MENRLNMQDHQPSIDPLFTLAQRKEEQKGSDNRRQALPSYCRNSVSLMPNNHKLPMEGNFPRTKQIRRHLARAHHRRRQIPARF